MLKKSILTLSVIGAFAGNNVAFAEAVTVPTLSKVNVESAFAQTNKPMQIAALSTQEMRDTQGAWLWVPLYYAPAVTSFAWGVYQTSAYMPVYHYGTFLSNSWNNW